MSSPPSQFRCTGCGATAGVEPAAGYAQLDPRYTTGHCIVCTPWPRPKKLPVPQRVNGQVVTHAQPPRKTVQLARLDAIDPSAIAERRDRERRSKLARDFDRGTVGKHQLDEAKAAVEYSLGHSIGTPKVES